MKQVTVTLALCLVSVAIAACGGSSKSNSSGEATGSGETSSTVAIAERSPGGGSTVHLEAQPGGKLAYTTTEARASAGKLTIDFKNPQPMYHNVRVEDSNGKEVAHVELIAKGEESSTVELKPGTYTYYCGVPGHRKAGMEGTLIVK
jgi:plastocyanin